MERDRISKRCQYCNEVFEDDVEIFCSFPYRNVTNNTCWCVCQDCRQTFLAENSFSSAEEDIRPC